MNNSSLLFSIFLLFTAPIYPFEIKVEEQTTSAQQKNVCIKLNLQEPEQILKQTLSVSLDNPHTSCGQVSITPAPTMQYLPAFFDSKEILEKEVTLTIPVSIDTDQPVNAKLHLSFLTLPASTMHEEIINLSFNQATNDDNATNDTEKSSPNRAQSSTMPTKKSFTETLQDLVQTTDSNWIRLLFAFLLGLLLSLTPCIYPMIPITIGILHNQGKQSLMHNFLGSCCYAFGLSTMFALLGLLAAFAGASFGSLLSTPIFVIILVTFIGYMSLTMIGVINLRIPAFLQRSTNISSTSNPYVSAYFFGLISGSVASPCVSPGLALLLTLVATMGNVFAGFLLLFCFGIGLSTPLIIIATFASSMQMLPQAGQWMVEIKKALGFVMLATCLYYLSNILPTALTTLLIAVYLLFTALFYIIDAQKDFDQKMKTIKSFLGILLLAGSVVMALRAYDQRTAKQERTAEQGVVWTQDFNQAVDTAKIENKLLMLDFWANHCTICKAIEKKIFYKDSVWQNLKDKFIFVKVDCTSNSNEQSNMLKHTFKVFAQPAILIVDPNTQEIIKKWSSEPYSMTPDEFVKAALTT
jgi:thioredoxin:protein disulfide reductase